MKPKEMWGVIYWDSYFAMWRLWGENASPEEFLKYYVYPNAAEITELFGRLGMDYTYGMRIQ